MVLNGIISFVIFSRIYRPPPHARSPASRSRLITNHPCLDYCVPCVLRHTKKIIDLHFACRNKLNSRHKVPRVLCAVIIVRYIPTNFSNPIVQYFNYFEIPIYNIIKSNSLEMSIYLLVATILLIRI